jgi:hypothetical protein
MIAENQNAVALCTDDARVETGDVVLLEFGMRMAVGVGHIGAPLLRFCACANLKEEPTGQKMSTQVHA